MAITHNVRIDMVSGGIPVVVHVGQYDDDFSIVFTPFASTGSFSIPSGTTAEVRGTKRDRNGYSAEATVDTTVTPATVTVTGDVQMTAIAGSNVFELVLTKNDKVLSSANFILQVEHAAMDAETVASESVIREIGVMVDEYLEDHDTALLAKKVNTPLSGGEADFGTAGQVLSTLGDGTTEWVDAAQGGGLTDEAKDALLACFEHVAWIDDDGQDYYDVLHDALYPPADLVSISAVYTQSGTVYDTDTLDSLKADLVVTGTYSDSTTATVTAYTLSGTLEAGTSTITVSYGGKTTTFTVTVKTYLYSLSADDFIMGMTNNLSNNATYPYATADTHRYSHVDFDLLLTGGKSYRFYAECNYDTAQMAMSFYNQNVLDAYNNQTSPFNVQANRYDPGWQNLDVVLTPPAQINKSNTVGVRIAFRQSSANPVMQSDFVVSRFIIEEVTS